MTHLTILTKNNLFSFLGLVRGQLVDEEDTSLKDVTAVIKLDPREGKPWDQRAWIEAELDYLRLMSKGMAGMVHATDVQLAEGLASTIELPDDPAEAMATWHRTLNDAVTAWHRRSGSRRAWRPNADGQRGGERQGIAAGGGEGRGASVCGMPAVRRGVEGHGLGRARRRVADEAVAIRGSHEAEIERGDVSG